MPVEETVRNILRAGAGMVHEPYDYIFNTWSGDDLVKQVYRNGGATGRIVAVIDMTYNASHLEVMMRSFP